MALQDRLIAEAEAGVEYEAAESDPLLQRVVAGLDAEEVRWRDGARAIESQWLAEREALIGWWRSDDAATLHKQVEAANRMADQLAESVSSLPPSRLSAERTTLSASLGLDALDAATVTRLCEKELGAAESPEATTALRIENLLRACSCWGSALAEQLAPTLERAVFATDDHRREDEEEEEAEGAEGERVRIPRALRPCRSHHPPAALLAPGNSPRHRSTTHSHIDRQHVRPDTAPPPRLTVARHPRPDTAPPPTLTVARHPRPDTAHPPEQTSTSPTSGRGECRRSRRTTAGKPAAGFEPAACGWHCWVTPLSRCPAGCAWRRDRDRCLCPLMPLTATAAHETSARCAQRARRRCGTPCACRRDVPIARAYCGRDPSGAARRAAAAHTRLCDGWSQCRRCEQHRANEA